MNIEIIQRRSNGLKIIDLFCGAGIGAKGFILSGFDIVYAIDNQQYAVDTYNKNIGEHAVCGDIRLLNAEDMPYADIITGGFPCQPFSFIGKGEGVNDKEKGDLGWHFFRIVKEVKPKAFLFENVSGLTSKKHKIFLNDLITQFEQLGYNVYYPKKESGDVDVLDCYDYGIPQHRKRVFVVGIRSDIKKTFTFPEKVDSEDRKTIRDAIGDLNEPNDIFNKSGLGIRKDEMPFVDKVSPGGNWRDLTVEDQRIFLGGAFNSGGGRTGFLRKVDFDKPAHTITSMMDGKNNAQIVDVRNKYKTNSLPEGMVANRRFTVRECLRLQTVPDDFSFDDAISIRKQYERCSGIPTLMAYKLGIELEKALRIIE